MKVAFISNKTNVFVRSLGKELLSQAYLLIKQGKYKSQLILPEYDSIAKLLDDSPWEIGVNDPIDYRRLKKYDLLIWEWGWTCHGPEMISNLRKKSNIPILMYPGVLDRFWREVDPHVIQKHLEVSALVDYVGVFLKDTIEYYQALLPEAKVFHLPVPVDTELLKSFAIPLEKRDKDRILLTAPSIFSGKASQLPMSTYLAFRRVLRDSPNVYGSAFVCSNSEENEALKIFKQLGIDRSLVLESFTRPMFKFLDKIRSAYCGLTLPHTLIQGRHALTCACLGIPLVVSDDIETHRTLYPNSLAKWTNPVLAADLCNRLIKDKSFYAEVRDVAYNAVEYYNIENSRHRLRVALSKICDKVSS